MKEAVNNDKKIDYFGGYMYLHIHFSIYIAYVLIKK